jgi:transaldolase
LRSGGGQEVVAAAWLSSPSRVAVSSVGLSWLAMSRRWSAIVNARLAYRNHEEVLASDRWAALARVGARPQRPLWASTGVKDPAYADARYVVELVAPGVVNTMPQATLDAVADHGSVRGDSIRGSYPAAREVLDDLAALGVDYDDVVQTLEDDGLASFDASWNQLGQQLARTLTTRLAG